MTRSSGSGWVADSSKIRRASARRVWNEQSHGKYSLPTGRNSHVSLRLSMVGSVYLGLFQLLALSKALLG